MSGAEDVGKAEAAADGDAEGAADGDRALGGGQFLHLLTYKSNDIPTKKTAIRTPLPH